MARLGFVVLVVGFATTAVPAQPVTRAELKPGLIFTSTAPDREPLSRLEPTVALTLGAGEAEHPRAGASRIFRWTGYLNVVQAGSYRFEANLTGRVEVRVAGATVLSATGAPAVGPEVKLEAGYQPFEAVLTRIGPAVRLELLWRGPGFRTEPVPYFFFGHRPGNRPAHFSADLARDHGRFLFEELSCARCHLADAGKKAGLAERTGPNLSDLGRRVDPGWLDAWLADPHKLRPDTVMPSLFAADATGQAERHAIVAYLTSLGGPVPSNRKVSSGELQRSLSNGQRLYLTAGCAACHGDQSGATAKPDDPDVEEKPPLRPADSVYAIGTAGPQSTYRLGAPGSKTRPEALARYLENPLAVNPHGRMPNMVLSGSEALDLARYLCQKTDDSIPRGLPARPRTAPAELFSKLTNSIRDRWRFAKASPTEQWREVGKRLLTTKGCVNCHAVEPGGKPLPKLANVAPLLHSSAGCLADRPNPSRTPVYRLDAGQKSALAAFVKDGLTADASPAPVYQVKAALRRFNCLNCHNRDGEGGFSPDLSERMRLVEKAENADDVSPPRLTGAGHKLQTPWLHQVLTQGGRARPWMTLRMPQYGPANVGFLTEALPKLEGTLAEIAIEKVALTPDRIEVGRTLTGKNGHGCISCHDISGVTGGGTRGPDLALTSQRVRREWYERWMHQPQRIAPGTRMPSVAIDGKALLTSVYDGDAEKQFEALWAYLALGPGLPLPAGMEPPKGVVVAVKNQPELLRTFLPEAGSKAIAVGYPGGVNVAFDAAQCRLAFAWSGNFLDVSPVWNNRGGNPARLLGPKFWSAPAGFPWAVTTDQAAPDFTRRATDPAYGVPLPDDRFSAAARLVHFDGYTLDGSGQPTFRYALLDPAGKVRLGVAEKPEALPISVASGIRRRFAVDLPEHETTWLFAGTAVRPPRLYRPDGNVRVIEPRIGGAEAPAVGTRLALPQEGERAIVLDLTAAPPGSAWRFVRTQGGAWMVLLRLPGSATRAAVPVVLSIWGLPRDEEQLLRGLRVN
jgi:mono/diheme cytochrome c family protein